MDLHSLTADQRQALQLSFKKLHQELESFFEILQIEKEAIRHSDTEKLEQNLTKKSTSADLIEQHIQHIENLTGRSLLDWFSQENSQELGEWSQSIVELKALTQNCHDLNIANGISINILNNMNNVSLGILSGKDPDMKTYGAKGQARSGKDQGRTIGKA